MKQKTNLTIDKFRELLSSVGSQRGAEADGSDCIKYDFCKARYFNAEQVGKLNDFAGRSAKIMAGRFANFYGSNFVVSLSAIEQQYLADYLKTKGEGGIDSLFLAFGPDGQGKAGFVEVKQDAAMHWLKEVLGESESQEASELSQLEQSFLFDIVAIFVGSLTGAEKTLGFKSIASVSKERPDLKIEPTDVLCVFGFDVKKNDTEDNFHINIIIIAAMLDSPAERKTQAETKLSDKELADIIAYHIGDCLVAVTIQFDTTMLTFEEVMTVQEDDVIVLDRKVTEQAGIYLSGRKLFGGKLARVGANKALVISQGTLR